MKRQLGVSVLLLGLAIVFSQRASANDCCRPACPPPCLVEKTVLVPQMTTETRKITVMECRPETRTRTASFCRLVEEKKEVTYEYCEWKQEVRTRQETFQVSVPEWKDVTTEYTVMVPATEKRQGVRKVARCVPTTEKRVVCEAGGHWEERQIPIQTFIRGCDDCGRPTCTPQTTMCTQKVWVPEITRKEIDVTVYKVVCEDQPYEYEVAVCKPEKRTCTTKVCTYRCETRTRDVQCVVCVPEKKYGTRTVTFCKPVFELKEETYTAMVPCRVEKEVQVCVCKMVEKKVQVAACCPVPVCAPQPVCCSAPRCCQVTAVCCKPVPVCCQAPPVCCQ